MKTIWIVQGSTGEYSDHTEWVVRAFVSKVKAERLVVEAQARANEIGIAKSDYSGSWWTLEGNKDPRTVNEFDLNMQLDYTGTHYTCFEVELDEAE